LNALTPPLLEVGLYVHFAYCARRCVYCDFALATPRQIPAPAYTDALIAELRARLGPPRTGLTPLSPSARARTLYIGGGTPSLWPRPELARFLAAQQAEIPLCDGAEVTLEANPEEVDETMVDELVALGINRISLGVQSLDEDQLSRLSRLHGRSRAESAMYLLKIAHRESRLQSFSVDLMYGLPGQSLSQWLTLLDDVVSRFEPPHLSCYALTVESKTVLGLDVRKGRASPPDESLQADMLFAARERLEAHGYLHYEVSSWAREGHIARHNSAYWEMRPYLALGAGAHGFLDGVRYRNDGRPSRYIERLLVEHSSPELETERVSAEGLEFERVMTGLRRLDLGVAPGDRRYAEVVAREVAAGRLELDGDRLRLTALGLRFMDDVLLAFAP
jgi:putative oxygen-independent coproporphyrinogen III oxidase